MRDDRDIDAEKRQRDFDDLQRELTGSDVGRITRFLSAGDARSPEERRKKRTKEAERRRLAELLLDPEYNALYTELGTRLSAAETATDRAISEIGAQIQTANQSIEDMEGAAARGPDGQPVFRYSDGRVVDANGNALPPEVAEGIIWPADAPSAEEYFAEVARRDALEAHLRDMDAYRHDVLGGLRDRYEDEDTPMSKGGLKDALDDIEKLRPAALSIESDAALSSRAADITPTAFPTLPPISQ